MKSTRLIGLAGFLFALRSLLGAGTPSDVAPLFTRIVDAVSVPAEISGHQLFVNIMVNGRGPFRVIVDTGCSITLVSPELAEAAGVSVPEGDEDTVIARNGLGDPADVQRIALGTVDLGGVQFDGVMAAVSDSFGRLSAIQGRRVDGALGFTLFSDLFLGLDFPNHRVLLSSKWPAQIPAIRASLPLLEQADVPYVLAQIQGQSIEVMLDTGDNQALQLPPELASSFQWKEQPRAGALLAVVGEVGREGIGRLAGNLSLGKIQEIEPTAVISPGAARIGIRSLDRFCVIFHQAEKRVWLCGSDAAPIMPKTERTDGLSLYSDPGGWRIAGVIPGSPAEQAHLTAGSLVTQIEETPATSWTRDQMEQWIESHANVALVVADNDGNRTLTLPIWNLVP